MKRGGIGARMTVALWGVPFVLALTWLGGWWTAAMIAAIALLALREYYNLQVRLGRRPLRWLGLGLGLVVVAAWLRGSAAVGWTIAASFLVISIIGLLAGRSHQDILTTFGGLCFPPLLAGSFLVIRTWDGMDGAILHEGRWLAVCVWGAIWIGDTAAYACGRWFGRRSLAPKVSPHKTVEGFFFGIVGALLFCIIWWWAGFVRFDIALVVTLAVGLFGQMGDLVESAIKREGGVKDSGDMLPGHGGMLDRFDSFFATAPVVAIYLVIRGYLS